MNIRKPASWILALTFAAVGVLGCEPTDTTAGAERGASALTEKLCESMGLDRDRCASVPDLTTAKITCIRIVEGSRTYSCCSDGRRLRCFDITKS